MDTISTFIVLSIPHLWPLVGSSLASDLRLKISNRQCIIKTCRYTATLFLVYWWFLFVYVYKRAMDTLSTFIVPSITLL